MNRRDFLAASGAMLPLTAALGRSQAQTPPPNILYIMADDMGWADLSCYGRQEYKTTHIDRIAQHGLRFLQAYSASPVCTPTRCAFNTGRYPGRLAIGVKEPLTWHRNIGDAVGLPAEVPTVASYLKKAGYETILIGKWHLGYLPTYSPLKSGFNHFFGIMSGGVDYFTHKDALGDPDLFEDEVPVEKAGYITDLITDRAVAFLKQKHHAPFFLSLNYTAPHWPWEGPDDEAKSKILKDWLTEGGSEDVYARMMLSLDAGVGRVLNTLRDQGLTQNTLIVFTSDNGGERFSKNWPFRGEKYDLLEGGIRVPALVSWPGHIPKSKTTSQVAISMDWNRTMLSAAGVTPDAAYPSDGTDLLPVLSGQAEPFSRTLYWRTKTQRAVRMDGWKYYFRQQKVKDCIEETEFLYNIDRDARENTDFKGTEVAKFEELKAMHQRWNNDMLPY